MNTDTNTKTTLVLGASLKTSRYSNVAIKRLNQNNHPVRAIGLRQGTVDGVAIEKGKPAFDNIDTVTMYINPKRQPEYYDYLIGLRPKRIIFNPGTANTEFYELLRANDIEVKEACTLVLLSSEKY